MGRWMCICQSTWHLCWCSKWVKCRKATKRPLPNHWDIFRCPVMDRVNHRRWMLNSTGGPQDLISTFYRVSFNFVMPQCVHEIYKSVTCVHHLCEENALVTWPMPHFTASRIGFASWGPLYNWELSETSLGIQIAFLATLFNHLFDRLPSHCPIRRSRCRDLKSIARFPFCEQPQYRLQGVKKDKCWGCVRCIVVKAAQRIQPRCASLVPHPRKRRTISVLGYKWIESLFLHGGYGGAEFGCRMRGWMPTTPMK